MQNASYDIIIGGGGAAGRILLFFLSNYRTFSSKKILFIEEENKLAEKTWCLWEQGDHPFQHLISSKWNSLIFEAEGFQTNQPIFPYTYSCIRGEDFDTFFNETFFPQWENITYIRGSVEHSSYENHHWQIQTNDSTFYSNEFISNLPADKNSNCLLQQFYGEYITFPKQTFDLRAATLMDFSEGCQDKFQFFYVLPIDEHTALVECTYYHDQLISKDIFKSQLDTYITKRFGIDYQIKAEEYGVIPLLEKTQGNRTQQKVPIMIGQSAGMIKPRTGYAFQRMVEDAQLLAGWIEGKMSRRTRPRRFHMYDRLLLSIIREDAPMATYIFKKLFSKKKISDILLFLDENTTFVQELALFLHLPWWPFLKRIKNLT